MGPGPLTLPVREPAVRVPTVAEGCIENGAVSTKKLKKNAVTAPKIKANAVTGAKVDESTLAQVPQAAVAQQAGQAEKAGHATSADTATNAEQLGGAPAAQFGSGIVGAAVTAPAVGMAAPSFGEGPAIGSGEHFQMPVPVALKVKNLTVRAVGDLSRSFVLSVRNGGGKGLACAGVVICKAAGPFEFQPGEIMELGVTVLPGPAVFGGATYQVGYQIVP